MFDVITIGSAIQDVFLVSDAFKVIRSNKFATGAGECVSLGSKIEIEKLITTTGGGATNSAATFASLGLKTAVITKVGDDIAAAHVREDLKRFDINESLITEVKNGQTGYSTLLTMLDGERTVLVFRGVSAKFAPKDIPFEKLKSKWVYMTSLGGNISLIKRIVKTASEQGAYIAWNPGSKELASGMKVFAPILPYLTVFNLNREEAEKLTKKKRGASIKSLVEAIGMEDDQVLLITDGPDGTYVSYEGIIGHCGTTDAPSISRTGAGDAFGSAFVATLMKTSDLQAALRVATLNAEGVIGSIGAKKGILTKIPGTKKLNEIPITIL